MYRFLKPLNAAALVLALSCIASAATYTVSKTADTNDGTCDADCSLREAIAAANSTPDDDVIVFALPLFHTPQTIVISLGEMTIINSGSLAIFGPGSSKLTLDGNQASRIITVTALANVKLSGMTFTRGNGASEINTGRAGAVYNAGGTLVIMNSVITGNTAANGGGLNNAASASPFPVSPANLTLINCTVSNNTATGSGGGMQNFSTSTVNIINSTFTGNTSNGSTGGGGAALNGAANIMNSTFSRNSAPAGSGGGIQSNGTIGLVLTNVTISSNTSLNNGGGLHRGSTNVNAWIRNSIIAGNDGADASPDVTNSAGGLTSLGNNLIGVVGTSTAWIASDLLNIDPLLGPFGTHGGTVMTHPLLPTSPALNAGQSCVLDRSCESHNPPFDITTDARYFPRGTSGGVDIGAYEASADSFAVFPNAGVGISYNHLISPDASGFIYALAPGSQLPPGLTLTTNANEVRITGTATTPGTYVFPLLVTRTPTLETEVIFTMITVADDPYNIVFAGRLTSNGSGPLDKLRATLTNIDGRSRTMLVPPFGYVTFEGLESDSAWSFTITSRRHGTQSVQIAAHGSVIVGNIELDAPALSLRATPRQGKE